MQHSPLQQALFNFKNNPQVVSFSIWGVPHDYQPVRSQEVHTAQLLYKYPESYSYDEKV